MYDNIQYNIYIKLLCTLNSEENEKIFKCSIGINI